MGILIPGVMPNMTGTLPTGILPSNGSGAMASQGSPTGMLMSSPTAMSSVMGMSNVFFAATNTPLFISSWHPTTDLGYIGTCIFLIVLAMVPRAVLAGRAFAGARWHQAEKRQGLNSRPWRLSVDILRALIDSVLACIAYLLMIAAMSMNVGYLVSVLFGVFLGSLLVGQIAGSMDY